MKAQNLGVTIPTAWSVLQSPYKRRWRISVIYCCLMPYASSASRGKHNPNQSWSAWHRCPLRYDRIDYDDIRRGRYQPYLLGERAKPDCNNCDKDHLWSHFCQFQWVFSNADGHMQSLIDCNISLSLFHCVCPTLLVHRHRVTCLLWPFLSEWLWLSDFARHVFCAKRSDPQHTT